MRTPKGKTKQEIMTNAKITTHNQNLERRPHLSLVRRVVIDLDDNREEEGRREETVSELAGRQGHVLTLNRTVQHK